jgi:transketolase
MKDYEFEIGKAITLCEGKNIAVIVASTVVAESFEAAKLLETVGVSATVVNMHTLKPLDTSVIDKTVAGLTLIITVEEHSVIGGLGSAVAEYKTTPRNAPPRRTIGLPEYLGKTAEYRYLLNRYSLVGKKIAEKITATLGPPADMWDSRITQA